MVRKSNKEQTLPIGAQKEYIIRMYETTDYDLFLSSNPGRNRKLRSRTDSEYLKLRKSIEKIGFNFFPIVVRPLPTPKLLSNNKKAYYEIIDGQHRLQACREARKPVRFVFSECSLTFWEMLCLASHHIKHVAKDFVSLGAFLNSEEDNVVNGIPIFKFIEDLHDEFNNKCNFTVIFETVMSFALPVEEVYKASTFVNKCKEDLRYLLEFKDIELTEELKQKIRDHIYWSREICLAVEKRNAHANLNRALLKVAKQKCRVVLTLPQILEILKSNIFETLPVNYKECLTVGTSEPRLVEVLENMQESIYGKKWVDEMIELRNRAEKLKLQAKEKENIMKQQKRAGRSKAKRG